MPPPSKFPYPPPKPPRPRPLPLVPGNCGKMSLPIPPPIDGSNIPPAPGWPSPPPIKFPLGPKIPLLGPTRFPVMPLGPLGPPILRGSSGSPIIPGLFLLLDGSVKQGLPKFGWKGWKPGFPLPPPLELGYYGGLKLPQPIGIKPLQNSSCFYSSFFFFRLSPDIFLKIVLMYFSEIRHLLNIISGSSTTQESRLSSLPLSFPLRSIYPIFKSWV